MKYILQYLLIFLLAVAGIELKSQNPHPSFKQYTVEHGLPSSEVYHVKQDSKGYMWFATSNGVSRFNGYEFENFSLKDGLPDNTVFEIFEDCQGRVWFLPLSCQLSYYFNGKIYPYKFNHLLKQQIKLSIKMSFYVDCNNGVFLGLFSEGSYHIDSIGTITHIANSHSVHVKQVEKNHLIYSTSAPILQSQDKIFLETDEFNGSITFATPVTQLKNPRFLLTTGKKLVMSAPDKIYVYESLYEHEVINFPHKTIWLYEDTEEDIWIGTRSGVFYAEKGNFKNLRNYLPNTNITAVIQDQEGGFWFTTEGNGVFYTPSNKILTYEPLGNRKDSRITCLATDGHYLYAATHDGLIHKMVDTGAVTYNSNESTHYTNYIHCMLYDGDKKRLIVSGQESRGFIQQGKFTSIRIFEPFHRMIIDGQKNYWTANMMGIQKWYNDQSQWNIEQRHKLIIRTNALLMINKHELYTGTLNGLWRYNDLTGNYTHQTFIHPLFSSRILDMDYNADSSLILIGTKGNGLLVYNRANVFQITSKAGLCGNNVYNIWVDGPNVWVATDKGLNKIILNRQLQDCSIESFDISRGLVYPEVNDVLKINDTIWIATNRGLSMFSENHLIEHAVDLPIYIQSLSINYKPVEQKPTYVLHHTENNIKINFVGLGYKSAGKHVYRYRMEGLDTNWTYTQNREVQFTTLPPNHYTFSVCVKNQNGKWSNKVATIQFIILTPFWQQWWFIISVSAGVVGIISGLFILRIKQVRKKQQTIDNNHKILMHLKLKALRAQMNPHFTFNVMNSIQHFIIHRNEESAHYYLSKFSRLIRAILNNSEEEFIVLEEELKALNLYLELEVMRFEKPIEYSINISKSINPEKIKIPSMLIQPYVENAINHGLLPLKHRKPVIQIDIVEANGFLKCTIEDNGIGRTEALRQSKHYNRSFGTSITKERLKIMNSLRESKLSETIIDLKDENGNALGTRIEIFIPLITG